MPRMLASSIMSCPQPKCVANLTLEKDRDVCCPEDGDKNIRLEAELGLVKEVLARPLAFISDYLRESTLRFRDNMLVLSEVHNRRNRIVRRRIRRLQAIRSMHRGNEYSKLNKKSVMFQAIRLMNSLSLNMDPDAFIGNLTLKIQPFIRGPLIQRPELNTIPEGYIIKLPPNRLFSNITFTNFR